MIALNGPGFTRRVDGVPVSPDENRKRVFHGQKVKNLRFF
jgi:hypothetical protein